jgi:tRNA G37 N-methylase TrmD
MQLHYTGSQEESPVAVLEEPTWTNPQELQAQEVPEEE